MENIMNFQRKEIFNLKKHFGLIKDDNDEDENYHIGNFIISPNSQMIAIIINGSEHHATCSSIYEYMVKIIDVESNLIVFETDWLGTDGDFDIFCKFSKDSSYFIHHSRKDLSVINLKSFKSKKFRDIDQVLSLDDQNQLVIKKGNSLEILSILGFKFDEIINSNNYFISFLKIQKQLYCSVNNKQILVFQLSSRQNKIYAISDKVCPSSINTFQLIKNQLILIDFTQKQKHQVQLRSLRNYKLLRKNISNLDKSNCTQDGNNFYICSTYLNSKNKLKSYRRFNIITGTQRIIKFILKKQNKNVQITNSLLVDLGEDCEILRYFVFDIK